MGSSKLALAMIVRDEEAVLARCLDSVMGVVDEMVIVDTGSTDRTKDIARSYAQKVERFSLLDFEWCDDFAAARNRALDDVTSDWVLQLDADEEFRTEDGPRLRSVMADASSMGILGLELTIKMHQGGDRSSALKGEFPGLRVFQAIPGLRYEFPIHEQVRMAETRKRPAGCVIEHFEAADGSQHRRFERNVALLKKAILDQPSDPYFLAALGNEYMSANDFQTAAEYYWQATKLYPEGSIEAAEVVRNMAVCMYSMGETAAAMNGLRHYRSVYPDFTDLLFVEGRFLMYSGDEAAARTCFEACLSMGDPPTAYATLGGTGSWRAAEALAAISRGVTL